MRDIESAIEKMLKENDQEYIRYSIEKSFNSKSGTKEDKIYNCLLELYLEKYFPEIDAAELVYEINFVRQNGIIQDEYQADFLQEQLDKTDLNIPFLKNCINEVEVRKNYCFKYVNTVGKGIWTEERKEVYLAKVRRLVEHNSFDISSKIDYLKKLLSHTSFSLYDDEVSFEQEYHYSPRGLFEEGRITASAEQLNEFIYNCEHFSGTVSEFFNIVRQLEKINDKIVEFFLMKQELETYLPDNKENKKEITQSYDKTNPYSHVFVDRKAFLLFERLYHNKKESSTPLAEFSFIYRRMRKDNLLHEHQKPEVFRAWLAEEPYSIVLDNKIKRIADIGGLQTKEEAYLSAKELIKK